MTPGLRRTGELGRPWLRLMRDAVFSRERGRRACHAL